VKTKPDGAAARTLPSTVTEGEACMVQGLGFRDWGLGFMVEGLGLRGAALKEFRRPSVLG